MSTARIGMFAAIVSTLLALLGAAPAASSYQRNQGQEQEQPDFLTALEQLESKNPVERGNAAEAMRRLRNKAVSAIP